MQLIVETDNTNFTLTDKDKGASSLNHWTKDMQLCMIMSSPDFI